MFNSWSNFLTGTPRNRYRSSERSHHRGYRGPDGGVLFPKYPQPFPSPTPSPRRYPQPQLYPEEDPSYYSQPHPKYQPTYQSGLRPHPNQYSPSPYYQPQNYSGPVRVPVPVPQPYPIPVRVPEPYPVRSQTPPPRQVPVPVIVPVRSRTPPPRQVPVPVAVPIRSRTPPAQHIHHNHAVPVAVPVRSRTPEARHIHTVQQVPVAIPIRGRTPSPVYVNRYLPASRGRSPITKASRHRTHSSAHSKERAREESPNLGDIFRPRSPISDSDGRRTLWDKAANHVQQIQNHPYYRQYGQLPAPPSRSEPFNPVKAQKPLNFAQPARKQAGHIGSVHVNGKQVLRPKTP
ncbi:hypothetical protein BGZ60DRAFT_227141 [Tricladium varicosporioides]|nr:hypothetical protein BGZ60DRAFT_227141 [Hymenoscyphus varicosporioides]